MIDVPTSRRSRLTMLVVPTIHQLRLSMPVIPTIHRFRLTVVVVVEVVVSALVVVVEGLCVRLWQVHCAHCPGRQNNRFRWMLGRRQSGVVVLSRLNRNVPMVVLPFGLDCCDPIEVLPFPLQTHHYHLCSLDLLGHPVVDRHVCDLFELRLLA